MSDRGYRTWDEVKAEAAANRTPKEQAEYEARIERLKNDPNFVVTTAEINLATGLPDESTRRVLGEPGEDVS